MTISLSFPTVQGYAIRARVLEKRDQGQRQKGNLESKEVTRGACEPAEIIVLALGEEPLSAVSFGRLCPFLGPRTREFSQQMCFPFIHSGSWIRRSGVSSTIHPCRLRGPSRHKAPPVSALSGNSC